MTDVLNDLPASPPIVELHVWIGHFQGGGEGMVAADLPLPGGLGQRHMPLMNSRRDRAESMRPLAERVKSASQHGENRIVRLELRTFRVVTS